MQWVLIGDNHFDLWPSFAVGRKPLERLQEQISVLKQALSLASKWRAKTKLGIVFMGDVFHRNNPHYAVLLAVIEAFQAYDLTGIPIYIIPGNHEESNYAQSVLQILEQVKGVDVTVTTEFTQKGNVLFVPFSESQNLNEYLSKAKGVDFVFGHFGLNDAGWPDENSGVPYVHKDVKYFLGHYHGAMDVFNDGKVVYTGSATPLAFDHVGQQASILRMSPKTGKYKRVYLDHPVFLKVAVGTALAVEGDYYLKVTGKTKHEIDDYVSELHNKPLMVRYDITGIDAQTIEVTRSQLPVVRELIKKVSTGGEQKTGIHLWDEFGKANQ